MNEPFAVSGIRRLSPNGKRSALFLVVVYGPNGTPKSKAALQPNFTVPWEPTALGVFANTNLLVTRETYDRDDLNGRCGPLPHYFLRMEHS